MTSYNSSTVTSIDIESERLRFRQDAEKNGRFSRHSYKTDAAIDQRTRFIFNLFSRTLSGRRSLTKQHKEAELRNLFSVVRREVVYPLLNSPADVSSSQAGFDGWHETTLETLKARSPIRWDGGPGLTTGMAQLVVNLHCKSMWAWKLIPDRYARCFHASITKVTLRHLLHVNPSGWTRWDSYERYMQLQRNIRGMAEDLDVYPLALECWNWNTQNID